MRSLSASVLAALVWALLAPATALATCMTTCKAALMLPSCTQPTPQDEWPNGSKLTFTSACETCCSPPGGPVNCSAAAPDLSTYSLWSDGVQLKGTFAATGTTCDEEGLYSFDAQLGQGSWELRGGNLILLFFKVGAPAGCKDDSGCSGCEECSSGKCVAPSCKLACKDDAECGGGTCIETVPGCCSMCQPKNAGADAGSAGTADAASTSDATPVDASLAIDSPGGSDSGPSGGADATGSADSALAADNQPAPAATATSSSSSCRAAGTGKPLSVGMVLSCALFVALVRRRAG